MNHIGSCRKMVFLGGVVRAGVRSRLLPHHPAVPFPRRLPHPRHAELVSPAVTACQHFTFSTSIIKTLEPEACKAQTSSG